ncbi:CTD small phosphatase-like protein 2, partial [Paramacrobiotus metropolitanus]|uniref:CTD small phosphatase-like protein 2 n=1 Tax=Paramacrobiotus metropolitanus TaxID=2943436 RepID=UPI0024460B2B
QWSLHFPVESLFIKFRGNRLLKYGRVFAIPQRRRHPPHHGAPRGVPPGTSPTAAAPHASRPGLPGPPPASRGGGEDPPATPHHHPAPDPGALQTGAPADGLRAHGGPEPADGQSQLPPAVALPHRRPIARDGGGGARECAGLTFPPKRTSTSSRDSGIDSATGTSDSEDSNASGSEMSVAVSRSIPTAESVLAPLSTGNEVPVVSSEPQNNPDTGFADAGFCEETPEEPTATGSPSKRPLTPTSDNCPPAADAPPATADCHVSHTLLCGSAEREDIPQFLQDIDDVISADNSQADESHVSSNGLPDLHCHSVLNDSTATISQEIVLQQERSTLSADAGGGMTFTTQKITTTYLYTASAGELEFVTEIFRTVQRLSPAVRTPGLLPPKTRSCPKFTLILDLDETLVHCFTNDPPAKYDHHFTVRVPDLSGGSGENPELAVFARLRPFVKEFLTRMARRFEVVVFTASMKSYSSKMLDLLDPDGSLIKYRFYRDHCIPVGCSFVKDLSIFARDLSKMIIVDNQIASFAFQIENGIPIRSWIGDDDDRELLALADFLEAIADDEEVDVRSVIRESLKIHRQLQNHVDTYYSQHYPSTPVWTMSAPASPVFSSFTQPPPLCDTMDTTES